MIDIRYHIYSLAAVFFALAVGIVVGSSFANRAPSTAGAKRTIARYESLIPSLKRDIETATDERRAKEAQAKNSEDFCRAALPIVAKGRLEWRNVAIIQTGDYDDISGYVKRALEMAGARVNSITDIDSKFAFENYEKVSQVLTSCGIAPPSDLKEAANKLLALITEAAYTSQGSEILACIEKAGVAKFTGDYSKYNHMVVLVGGLETKEKDNSGNLDSQLIALLEKKGAIVVGCEGSQAAGSCVPKWSKMGIATVDNADTAMGQVALICALNGEKAQFGTKETAERLIPQTLEKK
ncbi:MAG: copper transporter [Armatimonadetes bacterium]|nr:copper transporter [Armatimonadota bacterium]